MTLTPLAATPAYQARAGAALQHAQPRNVADLQPGDVFWHAPSDGRTPPCWRETAAVEQLPSEDWHPTGVTVVTDPLDPEPIRLEPGTHVLTLPRTVVP